MSWSMLHVEDLHSLSSAQLVSLCAEDRNDSALWSEFLRRFGPKIKGFIRGTLRQAIGSAGGTQVFFGAIQEHDQFQNTILRLVENDCLALRRFSGSSDDDVLAYLAVISRSTVRDFLREQHALKRPQTDENAPRAEDLAQAERNPVRNEHALYRRILAKEVARLGQRVIRQGSGDSSVRDQLIFQLYFKHGLSTAEIARCRGIDLTQRGVVGVLARLTDRVRTAVDPDPSEATGR